MNAVTRLMSQTHPAAGLRLFPLAGDAYAPALRGGDLLMVADTDRFLYDAEYLLDFGAGEAPYVATRMGDGVSVRHPNPAYNRYRISADQFRQAVRAIVVAEIKVKDGRLIREAHAERVAA